MWSSTDYKGIGNISGMRDYSLFLFVFSVINCINITSLEINRIVY